MIIINNDSVIKNKQDLSLFLNFMEEEVYDDNSEKVNKVIQDYLIEVFNRMEVVNMSLHERISEDFDAFAIVNFGPTANYSNTEIRLLSKIEDREIKEREKIIFNGIIDRHFKGLKSLWKRFVELDLD